MHGTTARVMHGTMLRLYTHAFTKNIQSLSEIIIATPDDFGIEMNTMTADIIENGYNKQDSGNTSYIYMWLTDYTCM